MAIVFFVGASFVGFSLGYVANTLISGLMIATNEKRRMRREVILPTDLLPPAGLTLHSRAGSGRSEFNDLQLI